MGGVSSEAERVIKSLNKAVAENTETPETEVATQFWFRMAIDIQRSAHRAFVRRLGTRASDVGDVVLQRAYGDMAALEVPQGI